jgi:Holliday junction resolvase
MTDKINSRQKGSKNEREVCKLMANWTGYEFARTPSSGGLRWGRTDTIGDIVCTDKKHSRYFRLAMECKFYKDIKFEHLINGNKNSDILKFWDQALADSIRGEKIPVLTMRYNGMKKDLHYVVLDYEFYCRINQHISNEHGVLEYQRGDYRLAILNSNDFFSSNYKTIHQLAKVHLKSKSNG